MPSPAPAANDNYPPIMTRAEAAEMCGLTPRGFDSWVRRGIVPTTISGTRRWSRDAILTRLSGTADVDAELSPYERQKAERNARKN